MNVAVVSVVGSTSVALAGIVATYLSGNRQRKHDAELGFRSLVWDRKSTALFEVIADCRYLLDLDQAKIHADRQDVGVALSVMLDRLTEHAPTIYALASHECSKALGELTTLLTAAGVVPRHGREAMAFRTRWEDLLLSELPTYRGTGLTRLSEKETNVAYARKTFQEAEQVHRAEATNTLGLTSAVLGPIQQKAAVLIQEARLSVGTPRN